MKDKDIINYSKFKGEKEKRIISLFLDDYNKCKDSLIKIFDGHNLNFELFDLITKDYCLYRIQQSDINHIFISNSNYTIILFFRDDHIKSCVVEDVSKIDSTILKNLNDVDDSIISDDYMFRYYTPTYMSYIIHLHYDDFYNDLKKVIQQADMMYGDIVYFKTSGYCVDSYYKFFKRESFYNKINICGNNGYVINLFNSTNDFKCNDITYITKQIYDTHLDIVNRYVDNVIHEMLNDDNFIYTSDNNIMTIQSYNDKYYCKYVNILKISQDDTITFSILKTEYPSRKLSKHRIPKEEGIKIINNIYNEYLNYI